MNLSAPARALLWAALLLLAACGTGPAEFELPAPPVPTPETLEGGIGGGLPRPPVPDAADAGPPVAPPPTDAGSGDMDTTEAVDPEPVDAGPGDAGPVEPEPVDAGANVEPGPQDASTGPDAAGEADVPQPADALAEADVPLPADALAEADVPGPVDTGVSLDVEADTADPPGPAPLDPCGDVPESGRCRTARTLESCVTVPNTSGRFVRRESCGDGFTCQLVEDGTQAACVFTRECEAGRSRCLDPSTLQTCSADRWVATACPAGCVQAASAAECAPEVPTGQLTATVRYQYRQANSTLTGWTAALASDASRNLLVLSYDGDRLLASTTTAATGPNAGQFTVRVPDRPDGDEIIYFATLASDASNRTQYVIGTPSLTGEINVSDFLTGRVGGQRWVWIWARPLAEITQNGTITITPEQGSGALRMWEVLRQGWEFAHNALSRTTPSSVVLWWAPQATWTCGACAVDTRATVAGRTVARQFFMGGGTDEGHWSDPVTAHEYGHIVMSAFGVSPGEGGQHFIGVPASPGLAWSEGWATAFSAMQRGTGIYYDRQRGSFFWFDIATRRYPRMTWRRARPADGLTQLIDENEVAAMIWDIHRTTGPDETIRQLASPRMTVRPFLRGYTRRFWESLNSQGLPIPWQNTGISAPFFPDFADAVVCSGRMTVAQMNAVTDPTRFYPYDAATALCR